MKTEHLARSYYQRVNAKDLDGLLSLFTEDAVFALPDGRIVAGKDALRGMYTVVFAQGGPQPQPVRIIADQHAVAAEVEVTLADGSLRRMASFFSLNDAGLFDAVGVYSRGG